MVKTAIILGALGFGATFVLVKSEAAANGARELAASRSFQEVHNDAHLDNLPVRLYWPE